MTEEQLRNPGIGHRESIKPMGFNSRGVLWCLPFDGRPVAPEFAYALTLQDSGTNMSKAVLPTIGLEIGLARQMMAEVAVDEKHSFRDDKCTICSEPKKETNAEERCPGHTPFKYMWFIDDDVIVPEQTLRLLIDSLSRQRAHEEYTEGEAKTVACGGIYFTKEELSTPVVYDEIGSGPFWGWKPGDIFPCKGIGTGCLLVDTSIFSKLEKPWFKTVDEDFVAEDGSMCHRLVTDDLYFCEKVIKAGYRLMADARVICGHYDYKKRKMFGMRKNAPIEIAAREAEAAAYTADPSEK